MSLIFPPATVTATWTGPYRLSTAGPVTVRVRGGDDGGDGLGGAAAGGAEEGDGLGAGTGGVAGGLPETAIRNWLGAEEVL